MKAPLIWNTIKYFGIREWTLCILLLTVMASGLTGSSKETTFFFFSKHRISSLDHLHCWRSKNNLLSLVTDKGIACLHIHLKLSPFICHLSKSKVHLALKHSEAWPLKKAQPPPFQQEETLGSTWLLPISRRYKESFKLIKVWSVLILVYLACEHWHPKTKQPHKAVPQCFVFPTQAFPFGLHTTRGVYFNDCLLRLISHLNQRDLWILCGWCMVLYCVYASGCLCHGKVHINKMHF